MVKLYALWTEPNDVDAFTKDYLATHAELCRALPGIKAVRTGAAMPGGPYHRITELEFESSDALMAALGGDAGQKVMGDSQRLQEAFGNKVDAVISEVQ